jgi:Receptor L domain
MKSGWMACACAALLAGCFRTAADLPMASTATCEGKEIASDAALAPYAECSSVAGDLVLDGVRDLSPLQRVRSITGALWIRNTTALESLSGLEKLESVPFLTLSNNRDLTDVSALSGLREVSSIILARNPELRSLTGMSGVGSIGQLTVIDNGLVSLKGLDNLKHVAYLTLSRNACLVDLGALNGLLGAGHVKLDHSPRIAAELGLFDGLKAGDLEVYMESHDGVAANESHCGVESAAAGVASQ